MSDQARKRVWQQLEALVPELQEFDIADALNNDPGRVNNLSLSAAGIDADVSRQPLNASVIEKLVELANACDLDGWRHRLFAGEKINSTEDRAAFHVALRNPELADPATAQTIRQQHAAAAALAQAVRDGKFQSSKGQSFSDVLLIGIGGSHLGSALLYHALGPRHARLRLHCLSDTDTESRQELFAQLNPDTLLVVVASKSFGTAETLSNLDAVLHWMSNTLSRDAVIAQQLVAISANASAMTALGVPAQHQLLITEWTGGRYSLWSAMSFPVACTHGPDALESLRAGAAAMDTHFLTAAAGDNLPLVLGLLDVWLSSFLQVPTFAILPYNSGLAMLPAYLQQLFMESNGKQVDRDGNPVSCATSPVYWGGVGQNGQHAYFQMLHQGTQWVPAEFILAGRRNEALLTASFVAQQQALLQGSRSGGDDPAAAFKHFPGNRGSTSLLMKELDAAHVGALLASYEHRVFVQSVIWNINPFDQMGVELGKQLARDIQSGGDSQADASTQALLKRLKG